MEGVDVFAFGTGSFGGGDGVVETASTIPASGDLHHTIFGQGPSHNTLNKDDTEENRLLIQLGLMDLAAR